MQTLSQQPQLFPSQFDGYHSNNHIQNLKRSSKSVSKYLESSSMLYSPNKRFIDQSIKNNPNTVNSRQYHQASNFRSPYSRLNNKNDKEETKNMNQQRPLNDQSHMHPNNLGRVVSKLQSRLEGAQVKIASLTNVVKLLQKYSQTKDDQYEKEKENILFAKNVGQRVQQIESLQIQNKIKEFNAISKQMKRQIQQVTELKHKLQTNLVSSANYKAPYNAAINTGEAKKYTTNRSKKSDKSPQSQGSYLDVEDLAAAFEDVEQRMRDEINKKMEICLRQIKKIGSSSNNNDVSGIDQNLFEEQINSLNFAINKVQNQCLRNKMLLDKQIEQIVSRLPTGYYSGGLEYLPRKYSNFPDPINSTERGISEKRRDKSRKKSHSRKKSQERSFSRDKSKSNIKSSQNPQQKLLQKKRQKEQQLKEAIRRKKQTKQRLKSTKN